MLTHLIELRRRALFVLVCFGILFLLFYCISDKLFHFLVKPLLNVLPDQTGLIATQVTSSLVTPLKLAADAAMLLSAPFALFQLWRFISPGLYQKEQQFLRGAIFLSMVLFFVGMLCCFYLVLPFMFQFFYQAIPKDVRFMPDMAHAIEFITRMLLLFGLCFQIPLITLVLVHLNIIDVLTLKNIRPYVIVSAFIIGMLLTPPDVFSQLMLALPICLLYEFGILLAFYLV
jgi:sec-independent protein translocase protein TatC